MKNKEYIIGLTIIIISFITLVFFWITLLLAIPFFLIGAILVFKSEKSLKLRIFTVFIPILLLIPSTVRFHKIYNYQNPRTFIIPKQFNGTLRIIWKENCGNKPKEKNGRKIYEFSSDGIIVLNERFDHRKGDIEYFLTNEKGILIRVNEIQNKEDKKNYSPALIRGGIQKLRIYEPRFEETYFEDLFLFDINSTPEEGFKISMERLDTRTREIVRKCIKE